ncbi:MAG: PEP-CTERM sorting domain-containing protein [Planctomycetota bacterium]|nr:PEP-CTERM sorting domain-containing protein [Planctomycetota bacterium]
MKTTILAAFIGLAGAANAAVLHDNGAVYNVAGSPNLSVLGSGESTVGFGAQASATNSVADDFTVNGGGWNVTSMTFYMYQTSAAAFSFTSLDYQIASSHSEAISWTPATSLVNGGFVAYRVTSTTLGATNRPIYAITVPMNQNLADGNYVLRWRAAGSLASGPWQPPVVPSGEVGNARQSIANGEFTQLAMGTTNGPVELPFQINGTVVPGPGSLALLGMGGLIVGCRRR